MTSPSSDGDARVVGGELRPLTATSRGSVTRGPGAALRALVRESDHEVCRRIAIGDQLACYELVRRYNSIILSEARRTLGNPADAEEARSELLVKLIQGGPGRDWDWPPERLADWVATAARRLATDLRRSRDADWQRRPRQLEWRRPPIVPDDAAYSSELRRDLQATSRALPPDERDVVECVYMRGLRPVEVCQVLEISRSKFFRDQRRALGNLADSPQLEKYRDR